MCGIVGVISRAPVNQLIYDACCCCSTAARTRPASSRCRAPSATCRRRAAWCARRSAPATCARCSATSGLGHVRYPTAGNAYSEEEAQPFYVNAPYGIVLVHNGNLTNTRALKQELFDVDRRHINTKSDTEMLINVLAHELQARGARPSLDPDEVFDAVARGARARRGLVRRRRADRRLRPARVPRPVRHPPAVASAKAPRAGEDEVIVASESVVHRGHRRRRDPRRRARRGDLHRPRRRDALAASAPSNPSLHAVHVRVRLPRAARLDHGRHLGLRGAPRWARRSRSA